jgi:hypothetical protein
VAADRDATAGGVPLSSDALFGQDSADVLSLEVELGRSAAALRRAEATDVEAVGSVPRRTGLCWTAIREELADIKTGLGDLEAAPAARRRTMRASNRSSRRSSSESSYATSAAVTRSADATLGDLPGDNPIPV